MLIWTPIHFNPNGNLIYNLPLIKFNLKISMLFTIYVRLWSTWGTLQQWTAMKRGSSLLTVTVSCQLPLKSESPTTLTWQLLITIGLVNNILTVQFFTGIFRNTQWKSCLLSLTECVWDSWNNALCDTGHFWLKMHWK